MNCSELMHFSSVPTSQSITINASDIYANSVIAKAIQKTKNNPITDDIFYSEIVKIEILVPNKVLRFTFKFGTQIKTICNEEDAFDFDFAIYLAYSKLINSNRFTKEGVEHKAHEMKYQKYWVKKVKEAKKLFKEQEAERIKKEREEKERAAARKRQAEKKARKKKERKERELKALAEKVKNVE